MSCLGSLLVGGDLETLGQHDLTGAVVALSDHGQHQMLDADFISLAATSEFLGQSQYPLEMQVVLTDAVSLGGDKLGQVTLELVFDPVQENLLLLWIQMDRFVGTCAMTHHGNAVQEVFAPENIEVFGGSLSPNADSFSCFFRKWQNLHGLTNFLENGHFSSKSLCGPGSIFRGFNDKELLPLKN